MPEALPAVTDPSFAKAGRSFAIVSNEASSRIYSSSATMVSPRRVFTVTGAISSLKRPDFRAAEAFCCDPTAKASCCSRVIWYLLATFSAVLPI